MADVTNRIDARDKAARENARLVEQLAAHARQVNLLRRALSAVNKNHKKLEQEHAAMQSELSAVEALAKTLLEENARLEQSVQGANEFFLSIRALLTCPLATKNGHPNELFRDPVVATDGHTYERDELDRHAALRLALGQPPDSPVHPGSLLGDFLVPNRVVRELAWMYKELNI